MIVAGKVMLAVSGCLLAGVLVAQEPVARGEGTIPAKRAASASDPATRTMVEKACSDCHEFTQVSAQHKNAEEWSVIVARMIEMGAPVDAADSPRVVAYLAQTYGPAAASKPTAR